ncbi:RICIN domain-containing protein [Micromonospora sp. WMMB482]|uniref:RICIN domain-containing protein n=2 Tax=unclassified Micromonospora TaxID=2617518 RepID=UPI0020B38617|nr:RICIN domain-containing protein [Micromonospora sp. WMMB482]
MRTIRSTGGARRSRTLIRAALALVLATTASIGGLIPAPPASAAVSGRNLPADGKVRLFMGQDSSTLTDYKRDVLDTDPTAPRPGGVTLYTNLLLGGDPPPLAGFYGPVNWGSGTVDFPATLAQYPDAALAVGLYLSDASTGCNNQPLRAIIGRPDADVVNLTAGYRQKVDEMVTWLKNTGREVFLRIGYEYDGPWNCYNADYYKEAFRFVKSRIDALGASRVATVWQSAGWPIDEHTDHPEWNYVVTAANHFDAWYPGDQYVDWVGLSAFYGATYQRYQWSCRAPNTSPRALQDRALNFARGHGKPVMIAEAAPQGFTTGAKTSSCIFAKNPQPISATALWDTWYADFFGYVNANTDVIRAVAYINTNWDAQTQWQCNGAPAGQPGCANGYWGDSRIQADPTIRSRFLTEIRKSIYVGGATATSTVIRGQGSNRCLDVAGGGTADGTNIILWDCWGGAPQQWRRSGDTFVNPQSGKCLDVRGNGTANGSEVWLWTCIAGSGAQRWVQQSNGTLLNPQSGRCLDADGWGTANGTELIIWACGTNQSNQIWRLG